MSNEGVSNAEAREPKPLTWLKMAAAGVAACGVIAGGIGGAVHWATGRSSDRGPTIAEKGTVQTVAFTPQGTSGSIDARVHVLGLKGSHVQVVWTLIDAENSRPVQSAGFQQQTLASFTPTSDDFTRDFSANVPAPPATTDFAFFRVQILDESKQELDHRDTTMIQLGGTFTR